MALSLTLLCDLRSSLHPSPSLLSGTLGPLGHCSLGPLDADVFQAEGTSPRAVRGCVESWGFWPTESELLMMVPKQTKALDSTRWRDVVSVLDTPHPYPRALKLGVCGEGILDQ